MGGPNVRAWQDRVFRLFSPASFRRCCRTETRLYGSVRQSLPRPVALVGRNRDRRLDLPNNLNLRSGARGCDGGAGLHAQPHSDRASSEPDFSARDRASPATLSRLFCIRRRSISKCLFTCTEHATEERVETYAEW